MSRQRTIWEKMSTLCPPAFILGSSLSMRTSFPADCTIACRWKSIAVGLYTSLKSSRIFSSAPAKPKTWLHQRVFNAFSATSLFLAMCNVHSLSTGEETPSFSMSKRFSHHIIQYTVTKRHKRNTKQGTKWYKKTQHLKDSVHLQYLFRFSWLT